MADCRTALIESAPREFGGASTFSECVDVPTTDLIALQFVVWGRTSQADFICFATLIHRNADYAIEESEYCGPPPYLEADQVAPCPPGGGSHRRADKSADAPMEFLNFSPFLANEFDFSDRITARDTCPLCPA
jgi:hypothetical protein